MNAIEIAQNNFNSWSRRDAGVSSRSGGCSTVPTQARSQTVLLPPAGEESLVHNSIIQTEAGHSESAKGVVP